jgi:hypothetical protein
MSEIEDIYCIVSLCTKMCPCVHFHALRKANKPMKTPVPVPVYNPLSSQLKGPPNDDE